MSQAHAAHHYNRTMRKDLAHKSSPVSQAHAAHHYVAHHKLAILDSMRSMLASGMNKHQVIEAIANSIDSALVLDEWSPGAIGLALEALDGPLLRGLLNPLWDIVIGEQSATAPA